MTLSRALASKNLLSKAMVRRRFRKTPIISIRPFKSDWPCRPWSIQYCQAAGEQQATELIHRAVQVVQSTKISRASLASLRDSWVGVTRHRDAFGEFLIWSNSGLSAGVLGLISGVESDCPRVSHVIFRPEKLFPGNWHGLGPGHSQVKERKKLKNGQVILRSALKPRCALRSTCFQYRTKNSGVRSDDGWILRPNHRQDAEAQPGGEGLLPGPESRLMQGSSELRSVITQPREFARVADSLRSPSHPCPPAVGTLCSTRIRSVRLWGVCWIDGRCV